MAGVAGFEPTNDGVRGKLTTQKMPFVPDFSPKIAVFCIFSETISPIFPNFISPQSSNLQHIPPRYPPRRTRFYSFTFGLPDLSGPRRSITPGFLSLAISFQKTGVPQMLSIRNMITKIPSSKPQMQRQSLLEYDSPQQRPLRFLSHSQSFCS